jgi:hypothetical protein
MNTLRIIGDLPCRTRFRKQCGVEI